LNFLSLIETKRDGKELLPEQIAEFVRGFTAGQLPDYQVSALLMAIFFRGLSPSETSALTLSMRNSGEVLQLPSDPRPIVDKHSTGGVGDKVSLPLAPLLASLGLRVPMISGRGLGITGGTLDKLDSIPGFQTVLPAERIVEVVQEVGCVICGQTSRMVPADKGLYALRDVTGTVPSQPLIVASILSKKLAEQLDALVLDVKYGAAAFMRDLQSARDLASTMVRLANQCGVKTRALLTRMDTPLGAAAGNWLEVRESVACLDGKGPEDLRSLVIECAAHLLMLVGGRSSISEARQEAADCLASGAPRRKWNEMLAAQGADLDAFHRRMELDSIAFATVNVVADSPCWIAACDARIVGEVVRDIGGGRITKDSRIDYSVGVDQILKPGTEVQRGTPLARVHASSKDAAESAAQRVRQAFKISIESPRPAELITEVLTGED
jgi:pyrimidine-nucleoside phosphorylase